MGDKQKICKGCRKDVKNAAFCPTCGGFYHPSCAQLVMVAEGTGTTVRCKSCVAAIASRDVDTGPGASSVSGAEGVAPVGTSSQLPLDDGIMGAVVANSRAVNALLETFNKQSAELNARLDTLSGLPARINEGNAQIAQLSAKIDSLAELPARFDGLATQMNALSQVTSDLAVEFRSKLDALNVETETCRTRVIQVEEAQRSQSAEIGSHTAELARLSSHNVQLAARLEQVERNLRNRDLLLAGVPECGEEDLVAIVCSVAALLSVNLPRCEIKEVSRIRGARDVDRARLILVKFGSAELRNQFLAAKRSKGSIYADELGLTGEHPHSPVFVNEHLTPHTAKLLGRARETGKRLGYRFVWTKNGEIYVKRDGSSEPLRIRVEADLDLLRSVNAAAGGSRDDAGQSSALVSTASVSAPGGSADGNRDGAGCGGISVLAASAPAPSGSA